MSIIGLIILWHVVGFAIDYGLFIYKGRPENDYLYYSVHFILVPGICIWDFLIWNFSNNEPSRKVTYIVDIETYGGGLIGKVKMREYGNFMLNLKDGWAGKGTYAPTGEICERYVKFRSVLKIPDGCTAEVGATTWGTISMDIECERWMMSAEIGRTSANYFILYKTEGIYHSPDTSETYSDNDENNLPIEKMAEHMNAKFATI